MNGYTKENDFSAASRAVWAPFLLMALSFAVSALSLLFPAAMAALSESKNLDFLCSAVLTYFFRYPAALLLGRGHFTADCSPLPVLAAAAGIFVIALLFNLPLLLFLIPLLATGLWLRYAKRPLIPPPAEKVAPRRFFLWLDEAFAAAVAGLFLKTVLLQRFSLSAGTLEGSPWITLPVVCVLAPLMEEWLFRGTVLPCLLPFGKRSAVLASALLFGLCHGNLPQFCYAFPVGIVLGAVALETGSWRESFFLHALLNLIGSVLLPLIPARFSYLLIPFGFIGILFSCLLLRRFCLQHPDESPSPVWKQLPLWLCAGLFLFSVLMVAISYL